MIIYLKSILYLISIVLISYQTYSNTIDDNEEPLKIKTIVIDAGHGGKDPGSVCKSGYEKDVSLAVSLKLGEYIEKYMPDVKVIYTRKTDVFVELHKRAEIANNAKADLFISIHVNSNKSASPSGSETLVLGLHRAKENFETAMRENAVILIEDDYNAKYEGFDPNSPESYIIFSLMQNVNFDQSITLAAKVQEQFKDRAKRIDRGVKQQGLLVLARTSMPGILIELGFLSNPVEAKYLFSKNGQDILASAIFRSIRNYKNSFDKELKNDDISLPSDTINVNQDEMLDIDLVVKDSVVENSVKINNDSIIFKVQFATSGTQIPHNSPKFANIDNVEENLLDGIYKYTSGNTNNYKEVVEIQKKVRVNYPDAFVVSFKNGKKIPLNEALKEIKN
ncbi:MAG: hypothetical protein A2033_07200 [Bacteroidetes bacterium GWA2_31_9]|nr:MAG: hypothetical protein A2033_07200 [Bacteroidetes bacterium GWA2_31_9]